MRDNTTENTNRSRRQFVLDKGAHSSKINNQIYLSGIRQNPPKISVDADRELAYNQIMRARQQTSTNKAAYRCSQYDQLQAQAKRDADARAKQNKMWSKPLY